MIPDEMKERFLPDEIPGTQDRMSVPVGLVLVDKRQMPGMIPRDGPERSLIAGMNHKARIADSRPLHLFDDHAEDGFLLTITIDKGLKRQMSLPFPRCRDDCLSDFHTLSLRLCMPIPMRCPWIASSCIMALPQKRSPGSRSGLLLGGPILQATPSLHADFRFVERLAERVVQPGNQRSKNEAIHNSP
jgi:hypothetical protein